MGDRRHRVSLLSTTGRIVWIVVMALVFLLYGGAMLSPSVSPLRTQIPSFLNLSFPFLLALVILLFLAALVLRLWRYAVA